MAKHAAVRRGSRWRRGALAAGLAGMPLVWLTAPAQAQQVAVDHPSTATVGDAAEAWFSASPIDVCTTPLGCPPAQVPTSPYPADTLHVGVAGGQETARAYLLPDLAALPVGAVEHAGTMTLPVASGTEDGTADAAAATIKACLATQPIPDGTQGSTSKPPSIDCKTSAKPKYDAKKGVFTLDLSPFLAAWSHGSLPDGIALIPDPAAGPTDAWHVAFNGRKRPQTPHISSTVTYTVASTNVSSVPAAPATAAPSQPAAAAAPPAAPANIPAPAAPSTTNVPPAAAPPVVATPQPAAAPPQQTVALSREFQYPLAFLMPLALLAGAVFFARLFTRDATPRPLAK